MIENRNIAFTESDEKIREMLLSHPAFEEAVSEYSRGLAGMHKGSWLLNRLMSHQHAAFRVLGYVLYLDSDREWWPHGATYSSLHELCTRRNEVGARVLKTLLAIMNLTGITKTGRSPADKRMKLYHLTPRMWEYTIQWLSCMARSLDKLQPEFQREKKILSDPDFVKRFLITAGRDFITNARAEDRMPEFAAFFDRTGGAALVLTMMRSTMSGVPMRSRSHIAHRYGLSKAQISNVIAEGAERGFLLLDSKGIPSATPLLRDTYRAWVATELDVAARSML